MARMRRPPLPDAPAVRRATRLLACLAVALGLLAWQRWAGPGLEAALAPWLGGAAPWLALLLPATVAGGLGARWVRRHDARSARLDAELKAVARRLLVVQEEERRSLSRELHDDIGQQITAIKLGALALPPAVGDGHRETIDEIVAISDQTIAKLRDLSMLLRPPQLDALGLEAALRWQAGRLFRSGHPKLELELEPLAWRPDPAVELACFRIAQEALTNVARHAQATSVSVRLRQDAAGALALDVHDDGRGFAATTGTVTGLGLVTMRERAHLVGGSLEFAKARVGTRLAVRLPMTTNHAARPAAATAH
ncbi:hypothetical protein GCM10028862_20410 [Luteimonas pelagia]